MSAYAPRRTARIRPKGAAVTLFKAATVVAAGNITSRVVALLIAIVAARLMSEAEFGAFGLVQSTLGMFGLLAGLSLGQAATRFVALYREEAPERVEGTIAVVIVTGVAASVVTAALMFALAPWLASQVLGNTALADPLRLGVWLLLATAVAGLFTGILTGEERFGVVSGVGIAQNVLILGACLLVIPEFRIAGAITAHAAGFAATVLVSVWVLRRHLTARARAAMRRAARRELAPLLRFCIPTLAAGVVIMPATWLAMAVISRQPDGLIQVGYYIAADRFRLALFFLATFVTTPLLPLLSRAHGARATRGHEEANTLEVALLGTSLMVVPICALFAFAGREMMGLFGTAYASNWLVMLPIVVYAGIGALGSSVGVALLARGMVMFHFWQQATYGFVVLAVTVVLRDLGAPGLALAHLAAVFILLAWAVPVLWRLEVLNTRCVFSLLGAAIAVAALGVLSWVCPDDLRLPLSVPVAMGAGATAIACLTSRDERRRLLAFVTRKGTSVFAGSA